MSCNSKLMEKYITFLAITLLVSCLGVVKIKAISPAPQNQRQNQHDPAAEKKYWDSVDKDDIGELKVFLEKYPNGEYAATAIARIKKLEIFLKPADPITKIETAVAAGTTMKPDPTIDIKITGEFVYIPAGEFIMGQDFPTDKPVHQVILSRGFEIGKYEVTQDQWERVTGANPSYFKGDLQLPVEQVSWEDAQEFIKVLNDKSKKYTYRLPTEAEWEYACRAETTTEYSGSLDVVAWYKNTSEGKTHKVGQKQPNRWGLYDMHGNVVEWCLDWYKPYSKEVVRDPIGDNEVKTHRISRGGSWQAEALICRSASRLIIKPETKNFNIGFRLVRVPK